MPLRMVGVVIFKLFLVSGTLVCLGSAAHGGELTQEAAPRCGQPEQSNGTVPAILVLAEDERTSLHLGRQRDGNRLGVRFRVTNCRFGPEDLDKEIFVRYRRPRTAGDMEIGGQLEPRGAIRAVDSVVATLFVDPNGSTRPGTYAGHIIVSDQRFAETSVPITVTVQYDRWGLLATTIFLPAIVIGTVSVWWKGRLAGATDSYFQWWRKIGNIFAVFVGLAAARAAWGKAYLDDRDFGSDLADTTFLGWPLVSNEWLGLATIVITAFVGAMTTASLGGDRVRGGVDAAGGPGRSAENLDVAAGDS